MEQKPCCETWNTLSLPTFHCISPDIMYTGSQTGRIILKCHTSHEEIKLETVSDLRESVIELEAWELLLQPHFHLKVFRGSNCWWMDQFAILVEEVVKFPGFHPSKNKTKNSRFKIIRTIGLYSAGKHATITNLDILMTFINMKVSVHYFITWNSQNVFSFFLFYWKKSKNNIFNRFLYCS